MVQSEGILSLVVVYRRGLLGRVPARLVLHDLGLR